MPKSKRFTLQRSNVGTVSEEAGQEFYCAGYPAAVFCAPVLKNHLRAAPRGASGSAQRILAQPLHATHPRDCEAVINRQQFLKISYHLINFVLMR
jgi:hypothetical protein